MDNFKNNIRKKYQVEEAISFHDSDWASFQDLQKQDSSKKNKNRIIFMILFGILLISSPFIYQHYSHASNLHYKVVESPNTISSSIALEVQKTDENENFNNNSKQIKPDVFDKVLQVPEESNSIRRKAATNKRRPITNVSAFPISDEIEEENNSNNLSKDIARTTSTVNTALSQDFDEKGIMGTEHQASNIELESKYLAKNEKIPGFELVPRSQLTSLIYEANPFSGFDQTLNTFLVKKSTTDYIVPSSFSIGYNNGIAIGKNQPFVLDDFTSNIGLVFKAETKGRIRYRTDIQVQTYFYTSNFMDNSIGVKIISSPTDEVSFTKAVVDENILQFRLGTDISVVKYRNFDFYLSATYGLQRTLRREIEYNFEGEDVDSDEDDIVVNLSNSDKEISFGNTVLSCGLSYDYRRFRFFSEFSQNTSTGKIQSVIPKISNLNLGLSYRF